LLFASSLLACGGGSPAPDARQTLLSDNVSAFRGQGTWWNPAEPGSGFFVDAQTDRAAVSFFAYDDSGRPIWYMATGPLTDGGPGRHLFQGQLAYLTNGPRIDAPFDGAIPASTPAGTVTLVFEGDRASVELPRRSYHAEKFFPSAGGGIAAGPETGIFWDPTRPGRGFTVEYGNGGVNIGIYAFAADGSPTWQLLNGPLGDGSQALRPTRYTNGQTLGGPWRAPVGTPAQEVRFTFSGACAGAFTSQDTLTLTRANLSDPAAPACRSTVEASNAFSGALQSAGSADGVGTQAQFSKPRDVAQDAAGNVYVADTGNHTIRKIAVDGRVTTIAGKAGETGSRDGAGAEARFSGPRGVAVDPQGVVFVADSGNHTVRRIGLDGRVTTFAGTAGVSGVPSTTPALGAAAKLSFPYDMGIDGAGNLYVLSAASLVRITSTGSVAQFITGQLNAVAAGANGDVFIVANRGGASTTEVLRLSSSGSLLKFGTLDRVSIPYARSLAVDADGGVLVTVNPEDQGASGSRLFRIAPDGTKTLLAGGTDYRTVNGPLAVARFRDPTAVAINAAGRIVVVETSVSAVRAITPQGMVSTLAGGEGDGFADGAAASARFFGPVGIAMAADGSLRVADLGNALLRHVSTGGAVSTPALKDASGTPFRFVPEQSTLEFVSDVASATDGRTFVSVYRLLSTPRSTVYSVDSAGRATTFGDFPEIVSAIAVAPDGGLYAAYQSGKVTAQAPGGTVRTVGQAGCLPADMAVSPAGQVYLACEGRHTVVTFGANGAVSVVAGTQDQAGVVDGAPSVGRLDGPSAVAVDASGTVYVADARTVRVITPAGALVTLAGGPASSIVAPVQGRVTGLVVGGGFLYATLQHAVIRLGLGS
jgi:sugar lactone lactonase YvrE